MLKTLYLLCLLISGCSSTEFLVANAANGFAKLDRHLNLPYGESHRQYLDVFAPRQGTNLPVVVFFYGGSWMAGSKKDYRFLGTALADQGIVAVIADYRLYPEVSFPAFDEDGARAVAWVEQHAHEFRGNSRNIVLMGHSAGGHTAAYLAFNHALLRRCGADPRAISGLVGLSGPYLLEPDSDALRAAFAAPYTDQDWQPIRFVDEQSPPTLLLHGLADKEVLPQESIELRDALLRQHVRVEMHLYPHRGHGATVAAFAPLVRWYTPTVVSDTLAFVRGLTPRD